MPVAADADRIMLFGGSFDPPHRAHIELAALARDQVLGKAAWLVFVPASRSPHKDLEPRASDADRTKMLRLATREVANSAVWTDEIDRASTPSAGPSYSLDTARRARSLLIATCDVRWLMGSDQAIAFHRWREPRKLIALASPAVMLRTPHRTPEMFLDEMKSTRFWTVPELADWRSRVVELLMLDASSTGLRNLLAAHYPGRERDLEVSREFEAALDADVALYIQEHGLYR